MKAKSERYPSSAVSVSDRVRVVSMEWKRIKAAQPKAAYEGYAAPLKLRVA